MITLLLAGRHRPCTGIRSIGLRDALGYTRGSQDSYHCVTCASFELKIGDRLRDSALGRSSFLDLVREEPGAALSIAALSASRWRAHNSR
jgi:hypothetical protein